MFCLYVPSIYHNSPTWWMGNLYPRDVYHAKRTCSYNDGMLQLIDLKTKVRRCFAWLCGARECDNSSFLPPSSCNEHLTSLWLTEFALYIRIGLSWITLLDDCLTFESIGNNLNLIYAKYGMNTSHTSYRLGSRWQMCKGVTIGQLDECWWSWSPQISRHRVHKPYQHSYQLLPTVSIPSKDTHIRHNATILHQYMCVMDQVEI